MSSQQRLVRYPIPPNFLDFSLKTMPFMIGLLASYMRLTDYIFSGTLLRAASILPCCDTFDFIVVGGGSTGSVISERLSENPNVRVLLIEAGGDPSPYSYFPIAAPFLLQHPDVDWNYKTVPQNGCAHGLVNQEVLWPRGKSLGGSSNSNFMIYQKGNPRDYDRWAQVSGNDRWKYENVDKYFRKIEDYYGVWEESGYHGKGGPLRIEKVRYSPGLKFVLDAARETGFDIRDLNHNQQPGFMPLDFTQKRGLRFSTYRAYIKPSLFRPNLVVYKHSLVTKIHFDERLRAVGVSFLRHGLKGYASARREIIISSGAINTPQLLLLSGIGPREHLIQHKIPPIANLPVGENLQDHVTTIMGPFLLNGPESFLLHRDLDVGAIFNFAAKGVGPIASPLGISAVGLASTTLAPSPQWPNIMFTVASQGIFNGFAELIDEKFNLGKNARKFLAEDLGKDSHFVLLTLGLPKSRGYIRLRNSNPLSKPIINPRYYSDSENHDLRSMKEGIDIILRMYENTTSFARLNAHLPFRPVPGCERYAVKTDEYFYCLLKTVTVTLYHPSGTCAMGKVGDPGTVVDSELRVVGVSGLRVADASIMPFTTKDLFSHDKGKLEAVTESSSSGGCGVVDQPRKGLALI